MTQNRIAEVQFFVSGYKHVIKYTLVPIEEDILQDGFPVVKYDDTSCYLMQATNLQERTGIRTVNRFNSSPCLRLGPFCKPFKFLAYFPISKSLHAQQY